ncbi:hypothetical protein BCR37DRAFT_60747 [Protomyces lactucae-debilis]|uniref:Uncharacterized protein n=1 Tax=Protomyces lactucae-debilis TaxID=2754530 RepID=A0A1Y2FC51_PROLT|nr:uncharacterized protein BCR37DRAFT_60747 [Protomyces lactucae-debilis]ORY80994.1 hypothetical protein BCR37DRAFT_60747 [Protomyces lactucae-debilis]
MDALYHWATSNGASLHKNATLCANRCIKAHGPIAEGESLLSLPYGLIITSQLAFETLKLPDSICSHDALILYLLDDVRNVAHQAYIASLPTSFPGIPFHWTDSQWQLLQGTNLHGAGIARLENLKKQHGSLCKKMSLNIPWDRYAWAHSVLTSRAFSLSLLHLEGTDLDKPEEILLPFLDMLDHAPDLPIAWIGDPAARHVTFKTGRAIDAGATLFNNYGPKPNEELLLGYGFTIKDNPYDTVALKMAKALNPTSAQVERAGVNTEVFFLKAHTDDANAVFGVIPWELVATIRGHFMDEEQAAHQANMGKTELEQLHTSHSPGLQADLEVFDMLAQMLESKLSAIDGNGVAGDLGPGEEELLRNLKHYRDGQLSLLKRAHATAKSLLDVLESRYNLADDQDSELPWQESLV